MPPHMAPTAGSDNTSYIHAAQEAYMFGQQQQWPMGAPINSLYHSPQIGHPPYV